FDNTAVGSKPSGWSIAPPAGVSVAVAEVDGHPGRALSIIQSVKTSASYSIKRSFTNTSTKVVLTFQVRAEQNNQVIYLPNLISGSTSMVQLALYNGKFAYKKKGGTSWTELDAYTAGIWYDVKVALDSDAQTFDLFVNNVQKLSQEPYLAATVAGPLNALSFGFYKESIGAAFFDEFHVYSYKAVQGVSFPQAVYEMAVGTTQSVPLIFNPPDATNLNAQWHSSDTAVMTVSSNGGVTAVAPGTAVLTATTVEGGFAAAATVQVYVVPITGIILDPVTSNVTAGSRVLVQSHITPDNTTDPKVYWSTDNPAVATVDNYGELTGVAPGTVKVAAANKDGSVKGETAVTVVARSIQHRLYVAPAGNDSNPGTEQAPFGTIARAQEAVRALNAAMTGDIEVLLRGGAYTLNEAVNFTPADSGKNGYFVTYKSYPGEQAVLSGGRTIAGWTEFDSAKGIYQANVGTSLETRQLFVDGIRAVRATSTGGLINPVKTDTGYISDDVNLAAFAHPEDLELVFNDLWTNSRAGVQSVTVTNGKAGITVDKPAWDAIKNRGLTSATVPFTYENAYELLDQPGEWYLDHSAGVLYYKPRAWENLNTSEVVVPVLERLMNVTGVSADDPVRNLQFENLHFTYTTWLHPSTDQGLSDAQNNHLRYPGMPDHLPDAAIRIGYANTVNFEQNDFSKLGITGIRMDAGTQNSLIRGNRFYDISGSAVSVGEPITSDPENYNPADHRKIMKNNDVINNLIHDIGVDYKSAAAISAGFPENMEISHNEIYNIPYSGTHLGYGWTKVFDNVLRNVKIENNLIYDLMGKGIRDGGAIYSLGMTGGTADNKNLVRGNYIRNQMDDSAVLYTDEGSTDWRFESNVIDLSDTLPWHGTMKWAQAWAATIHNVEYINNYTTTERYVDNGYNNIWSNNQVFPDANWPAEAQAIIAQAGIQSSYVDIGSRDVRRWSVEALDLNVGGTGQMALQAKDGKDIAQTLATSTIYYESANPAVASVDTSGTVTGISPGRTSVKASILNNGLLRTVEANAVVGDVLAELRIAGTVGHEASFKAGTTTPLTVTGKTVFGNDAAVENIRVSSTNPEVVSVTPEGVLTAQQLGSTVLVLSGEKLGNRIESYYHVRVWDYGTTGDYSLGQEIRDLDGWYVYPSNQTLQGNGSSLTIPTPNSGHAVYQGRKFQNELMEFGMTINGTTSWYALMFGKKSPTAGYSGDDNYVVVISSGGIELHRFNTGARTVIYGNLAGYTSLAGDAVPNTMLPFNQQKRVQLGTFEEEGGVRLILKVDGQEIFNYLDTASNAIRGAGYLGVIARSGSITLSDAGGAQAKTAGFVLHGPSVIKAGESQALDIIAVNADGRPGAVPAGIQFASSNPAVAEVDASGLLHGRTEGTTVISAVYGEARGVYQLTVSGMVTPPLSSAVNLTGPADILGGFGPFPTYSLHDAAGSIYAKSAKINYNSRVWFPSTEASRLPVRLRGNY
ncbi:MAG: hypothetical protein K0Q90_2529, partial [Paenibacillaceae bacterium]|nr:hypothetical protein [Paenibacillaceae bacterium]